MTEELRILVAAVGVGFCAWSGFAAQTAVSWSGGFAGPWSDSTLWTPMVVPNNTGADTYVVTIGGRGLQDATVTLDMNATIDALALDFNDQLIFGNSFDLMIAGGLVDNDGQIRLASLGGLTDLKILQDTLLTGSGEILMQRSINNRIFGVTTQRLTCDVNQTIRGGGSLGLNLMKLTNLGVIRAESGTFPMVVDLQGADNFNAGSMLALDGTLQITGSTIDCTGGEIGALGGGLVWINGGSVLSGGELVTEDDGLIRLTGPTTLTNMTNSGAVAVNNDVDPILIGSFTNDGTLSMESTGSNTDLRISGDVTIGGPGVIQLSNNKNNRLFAIVSSQRLTNGPEHTIRGAGQIGANFMGISNLGSIFADLSAGMTIDPSSQGFDHQGLLYVAPGVTLNIGAGPFTSTGDILIDAGANSVRTGDFLQDNGVVTVDGSLTVNVGSYAMSGGILTGGGALHGDVVNSGGIVNPGLDVGTLTIDGDYAQDSDGLLQFETTGLREGEFDRLHVTGKATLSGRFAMAATGGYKPQIGDEFVLITADEIEGEFDCAQFLGVSNTNGVLFIYEPHQVRLKVLIVPPTDFNEDGIVDGADLGLLLANYGPCGEECCPFDLNGTGFVDSGDLGYLLALWGTDGIVEKGEQF